LIQNFSEEKTSRHLRNRWYFKPYIQPSPTVTLLFLLALSVLESHLSIESKPPLLQQTL